MYQSAYDTTACVGFRIDPLLNSITEEFVGGNIENFTRLHTINAGETVGEIYGLFHPDSNIRQFAHPIQVSDSKTNVRQGEKTIRLFVDLRTCTRPVRIIEAGRLPYSITDNGEYTFAVMRAKMQLYWMVYGEASLSPIGEFPGKIFCIWISETLSRNLGLSLEAQTAVRTVVADHYLNMFESKDSVSDDSVVGDNRRIKRIADLTDLPADFVIKNISNYPSPSRNIEEMVHNMTATTGGDRLSDLSTGSLIGVLARSWRGATGSEVVAVSLEHPPTFMAMVYASLTELSVKNTNLAKIALMKVRDSSAQSFLMGIQRIAKQGE